MVIGVFSLPAKPPFDEHNITVHTYIHTYEHLVVEKNGEINREIGELEVA